MPSIFDTPNQSVLSDSLLDSPPVPSVQQRSFTDVPQARKNIYDKVLNSVASISPLKNVRHTLTLDNLHYVDPEEIELSKQKNAILTGKSLHRRLKGTWTLNENATGKQLDQKDMTIAQVPFMTPRGTFILNGTEYTISNQMRLRPGIFTRIKENGEVESHVNVMPGNGISHRYFLDPESGVFKINIGQAKLPLYPIAKAIGIKDTELRKAWGDELLSINMQVPDGKSVGKMYQRLVRKADPNASEEIKGKALADLMHSMRMDPEVTKRTLGTPHEYLTNDAILDTTKKLIRVSRQEEGPDDRDHLAFQTFHGPEDLLSERINKDRTFLRNLLYKISFKGNLSSLQPGALTKQLHSTILHSGLGQSVEEINPAELLDSLSRVTRLGEGGIGSIDAVPDEARSVQPSHTGYIDLIRTPESFRVGIDTRLAYPVKKGSDGKIYAPFKNVKTGKLEYKSPQEVADVPVAFPGEFKKNLPYVAALHQGDAAFIPREEAKYEVPHMENTFSSLANMIAGKSGIKGQRMSMGSRYLAQALSLSQRQAPYFQSAMPGMHGIKSFEDQHGVDLGAIRAAQGGTVTKVTKDDITLRHDDGSTQNYQLYNHFPYARKTFIHNEPSVRQGQRVEPDQLLAQSNYTDENGTSALGLNANIAFIPFRGANYEDAAIISESFAKRLTSEHMYQHDQEWSNRIKNGLKPFISLFPTEYEKPQLANMDDTGIVKPGTVVKYGDPLVLVAEERERTHSQIHKGRTPTYANKTLTWDHHAPGIITDVAHTPKGVTVAAKAYVPMQVGDKLCFDNETELLTRTGWKYVPDITLTDEIATLNQQTEVLEYQYPTAVHSYPYSGPMFVLRSKHLDIKVTPEHKLWVARPYGNYQAITAEDFAMSTGTWLFKKDAIWIGKEQEWIEFDQPPEGARFYRPRIKMDDWLEFLGYYIAEGHCAINKANKGRYIRISQADSSPHTCKIAELLDRLGFNYYRMGGCSGYFQIVSKWLYSILAPLGDSGEKYVPAYVQELSTRQINIFLDAYMNGDGHRGVCWEYSSKSKRLVEDIGILCFKLGWSTNIKHYHYVCKDRVDAIGWRARINKKQLHPWWNKHRATSYKNYQGWEQYDGNVFCVTVPNGVVYSRRNGLHSACHNSNRVGMKGVISEIVPDDKMLHDKDGKPYEIALNPLGIISRINPVQIVEAALGKIVAKTGKPYKLEDFNDIDNLAQWANDEMKKHNMPVTETITDPNTGRTIPNVLTGYQYLLKLHHTSESKGQGRSFGGYSSENLPTRGGEGGSKRIAMLESNALLSHGATETLRDAHLIRGQKNDAYWQAFMSGHRPPEPEVPLVYRKFIDDLKGAGINVVRDGTAMHVMALTNKDVDKLASNRNIQNTETVDWKEGLKPKRGGFFDQELTGGHLSNKWSAIPLHEPMPNPAFEEPIRRLLGLTQKKFEAVISGDDAIASFGSGPQAIQSALANIDVPKAISQAEAEMHGSKKTARDEAIRKLEYLKSAERLKIHPKDWMWSRVPVLPTIYRPVSVMQGSGNQLVSDMNYLYKELFDANSLLKEAQETGLGNYSNERLNVYNALKGVTGLGDPIQPKNQERQIKGLLRQVFGNSPKFGVVQRQLLGATVDLVGRAVITPNPDLDMDTVGLPEGKAWEVYKPFIIRRLVQRGVPRLEAARAFKDQLPIARDAMEDEMKERPVVISRAPVLHRYGIMGFWPKLMKGDTMQTSTLIGKGFGLDYDGDQSISTVTLGLQSNSQAYIIPGGSTNTFWEHRKMPAHYNTKLHFANDFEFFCVHIQDIPHNEEFSQKEHIKFHGVPPGMFVVSYDEKNNKPVMAEITSWSEHLDREVVTIELSSGRQIISDDDPRAVYGLNPQTYTFERKRPHEAIGMFVPRVDKLPETSSETCPQSLPLPEDKPMHRLKEEFQLDRRSGYLLGLLIGAGWVVHSNDYTTGVALAAANEGVTEGYREALLAAFQQLPHMTRVVSDTSYGDRVKYTVSCSAYGKFVEPLIGCEAQNKHLPPFYLTASYEFRLGLLEGLIDIGGSIAISHGKKKPQLMANIASTSIRLVQEIQHLLRSLSVRSRITPSKTPRGEPFWQLGISAMDLQRLNLNLHHTEKKQHLAETPFIDENCSAAAQVNMIPISPELATLLMSVIPHKTQGNLYSTCSRSKTTCSISRNAAKKIINLINEIEHPHWDIFKALVEDTCTCWDRVVSYNFTGIKETGWDLTVPGYETFMSVDGVILSNTMNYHVPASEEAKREVIDKLLPSRNLLSAADFRVHYLPGQEYQGGLYHASTAKDEKQRPHVFRNKQDAIRAYNEGRIDIKTPVEIIEH